VIYPTYPLFSGKSKFTHETTSEQSLQNIQAKISENQTTVSFLGIPSIGKSTILNKIRGIPSRTRPTTTLTSYSLTPDTILLDTPALPPTLHPLLPLLGLGRPTQATIATLLKVLNKLPEEYYTQLESVYGIPKLSRPIEGNRFLDPGRDLLVFVARKFGRMGKLGPNLEGAAEVVGGDVLNGKIQWWIEATMEGE
jgi:ribosome biogenesis GTPase A